MTPLCTSCLAMQGEPHAGMCRFHPLRLRIAELEHRLMTISALVNSDGWAATFQTTGQMRTALQKTVKEFQNG